MLSGINIKIKEPIVDIRNELNKLKLFYLNVIKRLRSVSTMKINKYNNVVSSIKNAKQSPKNTETESKANSKEPVKVSISKEAQALMEADKAAFSERVDAIKQSIQQGEYEVDPDKISSGLIKALQEQKG